MNKEKIGYQNISNTNDVRWGNEIKRMGSSWVQNRHFWLMGTISYFQQGKHQVFEDERQRQLRFLFNALDRELLPRKLTNAHLKKDTKLKEGYHKKQNRERHTAKYRLERVVYDETGANRDFPHTHFFIKGTTKNWRLIGIQQELIKTTMTELWQNHYTRFGTIDFKANSNSLYQTGYGYKEERTDLWLQQQAKNKDIKLTTNTGTFNSTCSFLLM